MMERLDPTTFAFFNSYLIHGNSLNGASSAKIGGHLREDLLTDSLRLVMQYFPTMRSRIHVDLDSKHRYFWQEIDGFSSQLPIEFSTITCDESDLDNVLDEIEETYINKPILIDQTFPFRIICTYWKESFTHILTVASHVLGDAYTGYLISEKFFEYYQALSEGHTPEVESQPYPMGDWEKLFNCHLSSSQKDRAQRIILAQYRSRKYHNQERYGDYRDWEKVTTRMEGFLAQLESVSKNVSASIVEPNVFMTPIPKVTPPDERSLPNINRQYVHVFSPEHYEGLRHFAKLCGRQYSVYDILQLAYIRSQMVLAFRSQKNFNSISMRMAINYRHFIKASQDLLFMPGNYVTGKNFSLLATFHDDLPIVLKRIWTGQNDAFDSLKTKSFLKVPLARSYSLQAVQGEDWINYLKTFVRPNTTIQGRMALITNNLGVLDKYLRLGKTINIQSIKLRTMLSGAFVIQFYVISKHLYATCTHNPSLTNPDELNEAWSLLLKYIEAFATYRYDKTVKVW